MGAPDDRGRRYGRSSRHDSRSESRGHRSRSRSRDRVRRRGSSRSRSRSRRHERDRDRGRDHRRSRSRSRGRGRRERRHSSRSRSREAARYRSRSHERGRRNGRHEPGRQPSPDRWQHDRFQATFTSGGRINEGQPDAGGRGGAPWAGGVQPSSRMHGYAAALQAGLDDELDAEPYAWEARGEAEAGPSAVLLISGLPEDATEAALQLLFEPLSGVRQVRVPREPGTQLGKGYAFLEFEGAEGAAALMGSAWREQTFFGQHRLRFEYARRRADPGGPGPAAGDWVCDLCQGINFARRSECYQCLRERAPGARVLGPEAAGIEEPSCILRVAGLAPGADEEALRFLFVPHAPVKDIRLLRDRYTGEPRGVAYIQFFSVTDAGKALAACQDARLDGQEAPLRLGYARDRFADQPQHFYAAQYQHHMSTEAAAEAVLAMAGWAPKEFGEGGGQAGGDDDPLAAWERQQAAEAAGEAAPAADWVGQAAAGGQEAAPDAAPAAGGAAEQQQQQQQKGRPESAEPEEGELGYDPQAAAAELHAAEAQQAAAAALAEQRAAAEAAGFRFDPDSGYMLEPVSGYYYDANSGLYCHPSVGQWGTYDSATGQFVPHDAEAAAAAATAAAAPGFSSAADCALALSSAQLYGGRQAAAAAQHGLDQGYPGQEPHAQHPQQQPAAGTARSEQQRQRSRRGAVIGASAQLDHQGLMVAARAAEERVQLLRKRAEMEEAKRRRAEARKAAAKQAAAGAAAPGAPPPEQKQQQQGGARAAAAQPAAGVVHGRIYESSWAAARRQQLQQQGQQQ